MVSFGQTEQKLSKINELAEQAAKELGLIVLDLRMNRQGQGVIKDIEEAVVKHSAARSRAKRNGDNAERASRTSERSVFVENCIYRKEAAISFSDCEAMSQSFERLWEIEEKKGSSDIIGPLMLEVLSPGIERELTTLYEFALFSGQQVRVLANKKIGSVGAEFTGILASGDEHSIMIKQAHPLLSPKQGKKNKAAKNEPQCLESDELMVPLSEVYHIYLYAGSK